MKKTDQGGIDQHTEKRWNLKTPLKVFHDDKETLLGHAVNITAKGMMIVSQAAIPAQKSFSLWLELILEDGSQKHVRIKALSVWSKQDTQAGVQGAVMYSTGFHLFHFPQDAKEHIQQIIQMGDLEPSD